MNTQSTASQKYEALFMHHLLSLKSLVGVCLGKFGGNAKLTLSGHGYLVSLLCSVCTPKTTRRPSLGANDVRQRKRKTKHRVKLMSVPNK